jgi:hypothetical protein
MSGRLVKAAMHSAIMLASNLIRTGFILTRCASLSGSGRSMQEKDKSIPFPLYKVCGPRFSIGFLSKLVQAYEALCESLECVHALLVHHKLVNHIFFKIWFAQTFDVKKF